jgi:hypothetical protein
MQMEVQVSKSRCYLSSIKTNGLFANDLICCVLIGEDFQFKCGCHGAIWHLCVVCLKISLFEY